MGKNNSVQSTPRARFQSYFVLALNKKRKTPASNQEIKSAPLKRPVNLSNFNWWFWFLNLIFIVSAICGWKDGYYIVIEISLLNLINNFWKEKSILAFPVQVRLVYFIVSLSGFLTLVRFYIYLFLLVDTFLVTFYGKCSIILVLKYMPWNRKRGMRLE